MQPLQDDFRDPSEKNNSITNTATVRRNLDATITMRSTEIELQNTIELRATASQIIAPKPTLDAEIENESNQNLKESSCSKFTQPLQCD